MLRRPPRSTLFPYTRSSDLVGTPRMQRAPILGHVKRRGPVLLNQDRGQFFDFLIDRKSTRLNSSHVAISYAVFCLKKKRTNRRACRSSTRPRTVRNSRSATL